MKLFKDYVELRNKNNPYKDPTLKTWKECYQLSAEDFSLFINEFPYRSDPIFGLIDHTANLNKFFNRKLFSRDCDDFARAWVAWGRHNEFNAQEVIVTTERNVIQDAHVVTILEKDGNYWLCNYEIFGPFESFDKALDDIKRWKRYSEGYIFELGVKVDKL